MAMKLRDIYSMLLAQWLSGGNTSRRGRMESTAIDAAYNLIFTKSHVKQIFRITGLKPDNEDLAFIDLLRNRMFEMNPNVSLDVTIVNHPAHLSVSSEKFTRAFTKAANAYETYSEAYNSQSGIARLTGKTYRLPGGGRLRLSKERLDDLYQVYISYHYLHQHLASGGTCSLTNIFIEIVGEQLQDVKRAGNDLFGLLGSLNIGCEIVRSANRAYMMECGPAVPAPKTLNKKFLPQLLFTEQNMAAFSTYKSRGLVGGGKSALLLGMDFRSRLPFSIDIFRAGSAQVFLLCGKTGSGKTYAAFQCALSALALGCAVTALDVKGREWVQIANSVPTKIITFDERHPSFVNTLRLDDMQADSSTAKEYFNTAVKGTVALLMLVINLKENEGNPSDAELVIREAVLKMYSVRHVDPSNVGSFQHTKDMTYSEILPILEDLKHTASYTPEQKYMLHLARARLHAYFGEGGLFADAFRNEISLGDVLHTPLVIFELNKNQNAMSDSLDTIRVFMIQFLDSKKKAMLKLQGKFLFSFYEELQRSEGFGNLLEYICSDVTGSRSNNAVIFLLMNSLKILQGERARDIRSNITSFLVGFVEDNDIRTFNDEFGKPWLAGQLRLFSEKQNIYRNCFAAVVDTGVQNLETVYKVEVPDALSRRFRTRTIKED